MKSATASSRCSTISDLQAGLLVGQLRAIGGELAADGVEERAQLAELVAGGRSSVTPNSPRPRRVKPLRMTWIGRSMTWASRPATKTAITSAIATLSSAEPSASVSSLRISSVETLTRTDTNASSPTFINWLVSSVWPSPE